MEVGTSINQVDTDAEVLNSREHVLHSEISDRVTNSSLPSESVCTNSSKTTGTFPVGTPDTDGVGRSDDGDASSSGSPWYQLRKDATNFLSQTLQRGRRNLWQLTTSRVSVLLSSPAVCSTSIHQFLRNYEDLSVFILAGEAFCGFEAVEFRNKLKAVCENYFLAFHRQNVYVSCLELSPLFYCDIYWTLNVRLAVHFK